MHIDIDKEKIHDMLTKLETASENSLDFTGAPDAKVTITNNEISISISGYTVCRVQADLIKIDGYFGK